MVRTVVGVCVHSHNPPESRTIALALMETLELGTQSREAAVVCIVGHQRVPCARMVAFSVAFRSLLVGRRSHLSGYIQIPPPDSHQPLLTQTMGPAIRSE